MNNDIERCESQSSRSRSHSRVSQDGLRSRSSSLELEVDSPPPLLNICSFSGTEDHSYKSPITNLYKKSESFSVSALLKRDERKQSPTTNENFELFAGNKLSEQQSLHTIQHRSLISPFPFLAAFAFQQHSGRYSC